LARLGSVAAVEGDLLDRLHELPGLALADDRKLAVGDPDLEAAGGEGSGEHYPARALADVDEAAGPCEARPEPAHVHVAIAVDLGHAQARHVGAAAAGEV